MSSEAVASPRRGREFPRILGSYSAGRPGRTLLVCGGIHGNEPAGALAAQRVLERIAEEKPPLRGDFMAVAGNLGALATAERYIAADLNRCWTPEWIDELKVRDPATDRPEDREQRALLDLIKEVAAKSPEGLSVIDLHTTSGGGAPFSIMSDTLDNRRFSFALPIPTVLGLEESIEGTLLDYLTRCGHTGIVVEGGQHADPRAVDHHEAVIWLSLEAAGMLDRRHVRDHARYMEMLQAPAARLPHVLEIRYRHPISPTNGFEMRPGYQGFQRVTEGEVLAQDGGGEVTTPMDGFLLMPLYQKQGNDGFFVARQIKMFWLHLSGVLRRMQVQRLAPFFPGVSRHPTRPNAFRVNRKVARWYVVEVFHLMGFRRMHPDGDHLVFSRRTDV